MSAPTTDPRPLRADARRNHERILAAARTAFAAKGLDAQMDDVARAARVGVGTVYRHFADKEALVAALADERFGHFADLARTAQDAEDPWEGLAGFLRQAAALQAQHLALSQVMAVQGAMGDAAARAGMDDLVGALIARAQRAGVVRKDLRSSDIPMIMCGLGSVAQHEFFDWRRQLELVLAGMRAGGAPKLPG